MSATRGISVATALLLLGAVASQAQDTHHPQPPGAATTQMPVAPPANSGGTTQGVSQMMPMMAPGGMMGGIMPMLDMVDHVDGRLAFLKAELKITDAQMPAWSKFAEAMRVNAAAMRENHAAMMPPQGMSAHLPTRLELAEKMMSGHLDALRRIKTAVEPLYAVLSDEQKETADELLGSPHGMM
jgi:hypothetical protein